GIDLEAGPANPGAHFWDSHLPMRKSHVGFALEGGSRDQERRVVGARVRGCQTQEWRLRTDGVHERDIGPPGCLAEDDGMLHLTRVRGQCVGEREISTLATCEAERAEDRFVWGARQPEVALARKIHGFRLRSIVSFKTMITH